MKITQEIKNLDGQQINELKAIELEMDKKSQEFINNDSEIYLKQKRA
jgi:phosphomethylpyrimidine synthase